MESPPRREPIPLQPRFIEIKKRLVTADPSAISASWNRLLGELQKEIELISTLDVTETIPSIDFQDITSPSSKAQRSDFSRRLRHRGVAIIRGVVSKEKALVWNKDLQDFLHENPQTKISTSSQRQVGTQIYELFWSPTQIQARAHPNVLAAQKFAMSHWHCHSQEQTRLSSSSSSGWKLLVNATCPVTYADRILIKEARCPPILSMQPNVFAHVDNGSVERWEIDGYGRAGTYSSIFDGHWEHHDPWETSLRVMACPDLYGGAGRCSVFRMFQGWLSLGDPKVGDEEQPGSRGEYKGGGLAVVPLLRHATAYFLLRPFFAPLKSISHSSTVVDREAFLSETNWVLVSPDKHDSVLHGALPSYAQDINDLLHPHLRLSKSLVPVPSLNPGDYLIWHPDLIHTSLPGEAATMICLPACPLTQTNALYLARQRKAFLLGGPGPDFAGGGCSQDESDHIGRPGVQEVNEAGGEDGLRAMGLYPWDEDEDEADTDLERDVLAMANGILFPSRFGDL